jgi:fructokinase
MKTVVCLGEMLIDFVPTENGVSLGQASAFVKAAGGAPANVAVGLARLGCSSAFLGMLGADAFGDWLRAVLVENGVAVQGLRQTEAARTALAFVTLHADGEREFLFFRNPSADMFYSPADVDVATIQTAGCLHYGSISLIDPLPRAATLHALAIASQTQVLRAYDPNLRLALWPDQAAAHTGLRLGFEFADLVKISADELYFLTQESDVLSAVTQLWQPHFKLVVVTLGRAGCWYITPNFAGQVAGFVVPAIDATGAGDAFWAGLLSQVLTDSTALTDEWALRRACQFANASGALATTQRGAIPALPTHAAVAAFLHQSIQPSAA